MTLLIREHYINDTEGYRFGDSDWFEPFTDDLGRLFRDLRHEYGRCISSVFVDVKNAQPKKIGWAFQSRQKYEDSHDTYIREVWVEYRDTPLCSECGRDESAHHEFHSKSA